MELQILVDKEWINFFEKTNSDVLFSCTPKVPTLVVVDHIYDDPDSVRKFALSTKFNEHPSYHKGYRTDVCYRPESLKKRFEQILGVPIRNWNQYGTNGCFQYCIGGNTIVYHCDSQQYAGIIFLSPKAPVNTGTSLLRSKHNHLMRARDAPKIGKTPLQFANESFQGGYLDSTQFDKVDIVGNVYNRLVMWDASTIHAANEYFGTNKDNGRLFQLFFFDLETNNDLTIKDTVSDSDSSSSSDDGEE